MKKISIVSLFFLTLIACDKDYKIESDQGILNFEFEKTSELQTQKISSWLSKANKTVTNTAKGVQVDLDFDNAVSNFTKGKEFTVVNQKNLNVDVKENYGASFISDSKGTRSLFIIKTINESEDIKRAEYYDFDNNLLFSTTFNNIDKTMTTFNSLTQSAKVVTFGAPKFTLQNMKMMNTTETECSESYGQAVMDCLGDAYSNHGWVSVWAWVQTAFIPQTALALAIACAADEYPNVNEGECFESF